MVKATTVQNCVDEEHDNSESESDDDDEPTEDELIDMLEDAKELFNIKRKECKDLTKELITLRKAFDELNASHESLKKDHEELCKAHKKLRKAHSSLCFLTEVRRGNPSLLYFLLFRTCLNLLPWGVKSRSTGCHPGALTIRLEILWLIPLYLMNKMRKSMFQHVKKGLTCDIIDESFYKHIIVASTNSSCNTSTSTSSSSDGFTCDASLMVENETLKNEVKSSITPWLRPMVVRTACLCAWVAKGHLSTKRDWAISPRKARPHLLITKLVL
jgi:hypothetical protein